MSEDVLFTVDEHVAYVTINRPERRNALSIGVMSELTDVFCEVAADDDVWAVLLTGAGDKAFCAGADLKELDERAREGKRFPMPMTGPGRNLFEVVLETYKPVVAALNGPVLAGGCELALACDLRIAADHAYIGLPEAKRGMGANLATVLLPRLVPRPIALEMLYTGDPLQPDEALKWGLYNRVVPREKLRDESEAFVRSIVANAPLTLRRYKEMTTKGWELSVHAALRLNAGPNPYLSEDREEGVRAFVEKRAPKWRGR
ncbi:enoyl-CoA hydratase/isomerase family protein [Planosporangium mesophilum]|uniref:Enoyl-CoA hydratase n=1 Tax=Planosporangium mesophilum TaxID=689768 RepID=A0A8J3X1S5_9ACTN|nr:enoyl-CoA hydratase-related protein [Planosporangium mesophilum]NJC82947.1 enoyl-CoA hydratase/isomerase family protein [Planosporangium mesophilum]GII24727.1 enoyl-CoA hydratase [Planosporangium mesophilum]